MNKWVKRKWLRALRSGEYQKGRHRLATLYPYLDAPKYCCLGVLACEMAPEFTREESGQFKVGDESDAGSFLPDDLAIMWGLDRQVQSILSRKNDDNEDFGPVIDYIENNL